MIAAVRGVTAAAAAPGSRVRRSGVDVGKDGARARHHDRQRRVGGRKRRGDDFVSRADPERAQGDGERVGTGADAGGVRRPTGVGELLFEGIELGPKDEPAAGHDPRDGFLDDGRVLARRQLQEPDHGLASWATGSGSST